MLISFNLPGAPTSRCHIHRSSSHTALMTMPRLPFRLWYAPAIPLAGQARVLIRSVGRFAKRNDTKGGHHLLQWMRFQISRCIDPLLEERLVLDSQLDTPKDGAKDIKSRLEVVLIVDGLRTCDAEVVPQEGVLSSSKFSPLVGAAPDIGATVPPSSRNALSACAPAQRHGSAHVSLHDSRHVRPVILRQQGCGGRNLLLVDLLGIHKERG